MNRHLVLVSESEFTNIISGKTEYLIRFFKKRLEFILRLQKGDLIYLRKRRGEVLGQFNVGKIILVEGAGVRDWRLMREVGGGKWDLTREVFEEKVRENSIIIIVQIEKLEQFITSPINTPKTRKEWVVLE